MTEEIVMQQMRSNGQFSETPLDLNTATQSELSGISALDYARTQAILDHRPF